MTQTNSMTIAVEEQPKVKTPQKARHVIIFIGKLRFHLTDDEAIKLVKDIYQQTTRRM